MNKYIIHMHIHKWEAGRLDHSFLLSSPGSTMYRGIGPSWSAALLLTGVPAETQERCPGPYRQCIDDTSPLDEFLLANCSLETIFTHFFMHLCALSPEKSWLDANDGEHLQSETTNQVTIPSWSKRLLFLSPLALLLRWVARLVQRFVDRPLHADSLLWMAWPARAILHAAQESAVQLDWMVGCTQRW